MKKPLLISTATLVLLVFILTVIDSNEQAMSQASALDRAVANTQKTLADCLQELEHSDGGWCELKVNADTPGMSSVWPEKQAKIQQIVGPKAVLIAWGSAAWDRDNKTFYFMGGGGRDYGGNEVYKFSLAEGQWKRLTNPSPLDHWTGSGKPGPAKSFWIPDTRLVPAASYVNDGLLFNQQTGTLLLLTSKAAEGAPLTDADKPSQQLYLQDGFKPQQYEFNPSETEQRNGLAPLTWRRIGTMDWPKGRSLQLPNGELLMGSSRELFSVSQAPDGQLQRPMQLYKDNKSWSGNAVYDRHRHWVWSIYLNALAAVDENGKPRFDMKLPFKSSSSMAFDKDGNIVVWDGTTRIFTLDPDTETPAWQTLSWANQGPTKGFQGRVFGKWVHLGNNIFAGVSSADHGIWIYKHPSASPLQRTLSTTDIQKLIDQAQPNSTLKLPKGLYPIGLRITKPLTLDLDGVELLGVSGGKGVLNINAQNGPVTIRNFTANADNGAAQTGSLAAIRVTGVNFDVRLEQVDVARSAYGVMTDNRGGKLSISNSTFKDIGYYKHQGYSHIVYAGAIDSLTIKNTRLERSVHLGHLLKSRAKSTTVLNSQLLGLDSHHSRVIDLPCGGALKVNNTIMQSSSQSDNQDFISIGVENQANCSRGLLDGEVDIQNSLLVFDQPLPKAQRNRLFTWKTGLKNLHLSNLSLISQGSEDMLQQEIDGTPIAEYTSNVTVYHSRKAAGLTANPDTPPN